MSTQRPNIIVFFTDQQRHDTTGVHGCPLGLTPNFDRLARNGTDVHHSFTCQPVCGPARACLQTGTFATTNRVVTNCHMPLSSDLPSLARCFNDAGYHTGYFGKFHLGHTHGAVEEPDRAGYDEWFASNLLEATSDAYRTRLWDNDNQPHDLPGYRADALTDALIRRVDNRVKNHPDQPFFYFTSYLEPHHQNHVDGYPAPDGYRQAYDGRWCPPDLAALPTHPEVDEQLQASTGGITQAQLGGYFGMVKRLDEALGRLCDALKSLGQLDNTIILFSSDHACHFKTRNAEYKRSAHESSIRVPTMLHGGPFTSGGRIQQLVSLVDLPATLLDAAGIDIPETFEGRSLLPLVNKNRQATADWPDHVYVQISEMCWGRALRTKRWKYILRDPELRNSDLKDWKELIDFDGNHATLLEAELYDLQEDPHELVNLIRLASHTPVRKVMQKRLLDRMASLNEPLPKIIEPDLQPEHQRAVTEQEAHA
ncbi:MAG: sulfatase-like hydrolase/transferase [Algisphaera sp.]